MAQPLNIRHDSWDRLVLIDEQGREHVDVEPIRAFPVSDPAHSISLCDGEGRELAYVRTLAELSPAARAALEKELARRQFMPIIHRIVNTPCETEPIEWQVETDRGRTTFQTDSEDDVHRNDRNQVTIIDTHGIRYLIPDPRRLDTFSRRVLDRFL